MGFGLAGRVNRPKFELLYTAGTMAHSYLGEQPWFPVFREVTMSMHPNEPSKPEPARSTQGRPSDSAAESRSPRAFLHVVAAFLGGFGLAVLVPALSTRLSTGLTELTQKPETQAGKSTWDQGPEHPQVPAQPAVGAGLESTPSAPSGPATAEIHEPAPEKVTTVAGPKSAKELGVARVPASAPAMTQPAPSRPLKVVHMVKPPYPAMAKAIRLEGPVDVVVRVDEKGVPIEASSPKGPAILQQAAMDAATDWRFRPALRNGKAVRANYTIRFDFKLAPDRNLTATS